MESLTHALTIDTVQPGALGAMEEVALPEREAPPAGRILVGCWVTMFGRLNQLYRLWRVEGVDAGMASLARPPVLQDRHEKLLSERRPSLSSSQDASLYDLRLYQVQHGRMNDFLELLLAHVEVYETWSKAVGVWVPLNGELNGIIHLWCYRDFAHYTQTRASAAGNRAWEAYRQKALPMLAGQTSLLLTPTPTSPMS